MTGIIIGIASWFAIKLFKGKLKIDDALDVSSVHGVTGAVGSIAIGIFGSKKINPNGQDGLLFGNPKQLGIQTLGVVVAAGWAIFWTAMILIILNKLMNIRITEKDEKIGLDLIQHGASAHQHKVHAQSEEKKELLKNIQ